MLPSVGDETEDGHESREPRQRETDTNLSKHLDLSGRQHLRAASAKELANRRRHQASMSKCSICPTSDETD
jgi:hypothetical protein